MNRDIDIINRIRDNMAENNNTLLLIEGMDPEQLLEIKEHIEIYMSLMDSHVRSIAGVLRSVELDTEDLMVQRIEDAINIVALEQEEVEEQQGLEEQVEEQEELEEQEVEGQAEQEVEQEEFSLGEDYSGIFGRYDDAREIGIGDLAPTDVMIPALVNDQNVFNENYESVRTDVVGRLEREMTIISNNNVGIVEHTNDYIGQQRREENQSIVKIQEFENSIFNRNTGLAAKYERGNYYFEGMDEFVFENGEYKFKATLSSLYRRLYDRKIAKHILLEKYIFVVNDESLKTDIKCNIYEDGRLEVLSGEDRIQYLEDKANYLFNHRGCVVQNIITVLKTKFMNEPEFTTLEELKRLEWSDDYGRVG